MFVGTVNEPSSTDPFYILMEPNGTSMRIRAADSLSEFNEFWSSYAVPFPITMSLKMWHCSDDDSEWINAGASAIVNGLIGDKLEKPLSVYGCVLFTGDIGVTPSLASAPLGLLLDDEALIGVYLKLVCEMESTYNG